MSLQSLESTISSLATEHIVEQLEQRSLQIRKDELKQKLQNAMPIAGFSSGFSAIAELWQDQWQRAAQRVATGLCLAYTAIGAATMPNTRPI